MTDAEEPVLQAAETPPEKRSWIGRAWSVALRTIARAWVIGLLFATAALSGIAGYHYLQTQAELASLRAAPGPEAYAVVAYRAELERQLRAYGQGWREESVPQPPTRPRLMEEIDLARLPEPEPVRRPAANTGAISAPQ